MSGRPVLAASAIDNVLLPDPARPVDDDAATHRHRASSTASVFLTRGTTGAAIRRRGATRTPVASRAMASGVARPAQVAGIVSVSRARPSSVQSRRRCDAEVLDGPPHGDPVRIYSGDVRGPTHLEQPVDADAVDGDSTSRR